MARGPRSRSSGPSRSEANQQRFARAQERILAHEFREVPVREEELVGRTIDAMGLLRGKVRAELKKNVAGPRRGRIDVMPSNLRVPLPIKARPTTDDGRTSFHFSHDYVSKTNREVRKDSGTVNRPGAARGHNRYIEREEAVAVVLEQAQLVGPDGEPIPNADGVQIEADPASAGAVHGNYIERQEVLAEREDGTKVLFTNISADANERAKVWDLIEEHEREPEPDHMTIKVGTNPQFWLAASQHPDCPPSIRDAVTIANPDHEYRFNVESNVEARRFLLGLEERNGDEKAKEFLGARGAKFFDGRGGRVQYRIIGELPHDLSDGERASILHEFAQEFEKRNLPYVAVMHAPDHTNDKRNWHFHLVYYDRPIAKMDDGQWDFAVQETFKRPNRVVRTNYPHRQEKNREVNSKTWVPTLRKRLAEITNDHLERGGIDRRLDARRYEEMGIHRDPQEHLGTKVAAMEAMGVATPQGYDNANREWDAIVEQYHRKHEYALRGHDKQVERWTTRLERGMDREEDKRPIRIEIANWKQFKDEAAQHDTWARILQDNIKRQMSRAERVIDTCDRQTAALRSGKGQTYQKSRINKIEAKREEALKDVLRTTEILAEEIALATEFARHAQRLSMTADEMGKRIDLKVKFNQVDMDSVLERADDGSRRTERQPERIPEPAREPARAEEKSDRPSLTKAAMDAWIEDLRRRRRRLVREGRRIVPAVAEAADKPILSAVNYHAMGGRLAGIKKAQDGLIEDVIRYIEKHPGSVRTEKDAQGREAMVLSAPRPAWVEAFRDYADDPALKLAGQTALQQSRIANLRAEDQERQTREAEQARLKPQAPVQAPQEPARSDREDDRVPTPAKPVERAPEPVRETARPLPINHIFDRLAAEGRRLEVVNGRVRIDAGRLREMGAEGANIDSAAVQKRLKAIAASQEREQRRLEAYVRAHPDRVIEVDGRLELSPRSPRDLVDIARKWSGDEEMQAKLRKVVAPATGGSTTSSGTATGGGRGTDRRTDAPAARPEEVRPEAKKTEEAAPSAPKPARPAARPLLSNPGEEDRRRAEERRVRELAEAERAAEARRIAEAQAKLDREAAGPIGVKPGAKTLTPEEMERAARGEEVRRTEGVHAKIDAWLDSVAKRQSDAVRQKLAAAVVADRDANALLPNIDRNDARRIRRDADAYRRGQQLGLGLDLDRDRDIKR